MGARWLFDEPVIMPRAIGEGMFEKYCMVHRENDTVTDRDARVWVEGSSHIRYDSGLP